MLLRSLLLTTGLLLCHATISQATDPPVSLELAVEGGFEIDGQQRWMNYLRDFGFSSLRMRGARASDEPAIENRGSDDAPRYDVTGVLTADNRLALPGLIVRYGQRKELTSWLEKLRRGGEQGVTAVTGLFGLTDKQLVTLHDALKKPVTGTTKGKTLRDVVEQSGAVSPLRSTSTKALGRRSAVRTRSWTSCRGSAVERHWPWPGVPTA